MPRTFIVVVIIASLALAGTSTAGVPEYGPPQLQVRSNIVDGFNLPANSSFNSRTPCLADDGQLGVSLGIVGGSASTVGLWLGAGATGQVVWTNSDGAFMGDCSLTDGGYAVFELTFLSPDGIYFYDDSDASSGLLTDRPLGASGWGSPQVDPSGRVGLRASFLGDYAWASWNGNADVQYHATDQDVDAGSPYWYLYTPAYNARREIAGKVSMASDHAADRIVRCDAAGSCVVMAEDQTADPASPYAGFDNSVALDDAGRVAFKATLVGGGEGVFLTDGVTTATIATTADPEISAFEYFAPRSNNVGQVVFRAYDASGLQAVFVGDGVDLRTVATEHEVVTTDLGSGRIDQHDDSTVLGGNPVINDRGDVAFIATLTPEGNDQVEWGSGIFVAYGNQFFLGGFESGTTAGWSAAQP